MPVFSQDIDVKLLTAKTEKVECMLILKEQASLRLNIDHMTKKERGRYVFAELVSLASSTQSRIIAFLKENSISYSSFYVINAIKVTCSKQDLFTLSKFPEIWKITEDQSMPMLEPMDDRNEELFGVRSGTPEWGLTKIKADSVWELGYTGKGVIVGGQDTGYEWYLEKLKYNYRGYISDSSVVHDYNWHDAISEINPLNPDTINPCGLNVKVPCDDHNHGTHTMGTMVGLPDSTTIFGVAPDAKWIGCRNMERGWGRPSTYLDCFQWFLAPTDLNNGNPSTDLAPDVINNSWGCPEVEGCNPNNFELFEMAIHNLRSAGVFVVVSAGNDGPNCSSIINPSAIFVESFAVGASNSVDTIAGFSSRGPVLVNGNITKPNILAPGVGVKSIIKNGEFRSWNGTSMAGPHVVGAVALLLDAVPSLKGQVDLIEDILVKTADTIYMDIDTCYEQPTLYPNRLNILKAINYAKANFSNDVNLVRGVYGIFPNPAHSYLNVTINSKSDKHTGEIFNELGHSMFKIGNISGGINIDFLPAGFYWLALSSDEHREVLSFIKI